MIIGFLLFVKSTKVLCNLCRPQLSLGAHNYSRLYLLWTQTANRAHPSETLFTNLLYVVLIILSPLVLVSLVESLCESFTFFLSGRVVLPGGRASPPTRGGILWLLSGGIILVTSTPRGWGLRSSSIPTLKI